MSIFKDSHYDYHKWQNHDRVLVETPKGELPRAIRPELTELLEVALPLLPNHAFIAQRAFNGTLNELIVFAKDTREFLGLISITWNRGKYGYALANDRIAEARFRGRDAVTSSPKKATDIMKKMFRVKNVLEHTREAYSEAGKRMHSIMMDKAHGFRNLYLPISDKLLEFLMQNYDKFIDLAKQAGAYKEESFEAMQEAYAEHLAAQYVSERIARKQCVAVYTGSPLAYATMARDSVGKEVAQVIPVKELPAHIREGVGMLKLVEQGQVLGDYGIRTGVDSFVLINEAKTDE